jgi:hypothetical protein
MNPTNKPRKPRKTKQLNVDTNDIINFYEHPDIENPDYPNPHFDKHNIKTPFYMIAF